MLTRSGCWWDTYRKPLATRSTASQYYASSLRGLRHLDKHRRAGPRQHEAFPWRKGPPASPGPSQRKRQRWCCCWVSWLAQFLQYSPDSVLLPSSWILTRKPVSTQCTYKLHEGRAHEFEGICMVCWGIRESIKREGKQSGCWGAGVPLNHSRLCSRPYSTALYVTNFTAERRSSEVWFRLIRISNPEPLASCYLRCSIFQSFSIFLSFCCSSVVTTASGLGGAQIAALAASHAWGRWVGQRHGRACELHDCFYPKLSLSSWPSTSSWKPRPQYPTRFGVHQATSCIAGRWGGHCPNVVNGIVSARWF